MDPADLNQQNRPPSPGQFFPIGYRHDYGRYQRHYPCFIPAHACYGIHRRKSIALCGNTRCEPGPWQCYPANCTYTVSSGSHREL